jgi:competence protein ComEC
VTPKREGAYKEAIISVGPNSYGHPKPTAMQRLADAGARLWRTDELGTIIISIDGLT